MNLSDEDLLAAIERYGGDYELTAMTESDDSTAGPTGFDYGNLLGGRDDRRQRSMTQEERDAAAREALVNALVTAAPVPGGRAAGLAGRGVARAAGKPLDAVLGATTGRGAKRMRALRQAGRYPERAGRDKAGRFSGAPPRPGQERWFRQGGGAFAGQLATSGVTSMAVPSVAPAAILGLALQSPRVIGALQYATGALGRLGARVPAGTGAAGAGTGLAALLAAARGSR